MMLLKSSQNSQEKNYAAVSWHRFFPVNFEKFLRASLQKTTARVILNLQLHSMSENTYSKSTGIILIISHPEMFYKKAVL